MSLLIFIIFNLYYSIVLLIEVNKDKRLKERIFTKIIFMMVIVQISLLSTSATFILGAKWRSDNPLSPEFHYISLALFEVFGEVLPIIFFCFALLKQILLFK